jgi:hypothetical protein
VIEPLPLGDKTRYKTISELARSYGIPESTARSWRDRFSPFLPRHRYRDDWVYEVAAFDEIYALCHDWAKGPPRRSLEMVGWELARRHPEVGVVAPLAYIGLAEASGAPDIDPTMAAMLERLRGTEERLARAEERLARIEERLA